MQSSRAFKRSTLRGALLAAALLFSSAALAGPPLLCHPFDTAGAASLPWGGGWNRIDTRITAAGTPQAKALALFDAGYYAETLQDIVRLQGYDMPGIGKADTAAIRGVLAKGDGSLRIAEALKLRADDASMRFASALVASADRREQDYAMHARIARAGARHDRLLALNVDKIAD